MARFPAFVFSRGEEPDPRFSLANERTFLAWIRTALGLLATGVALQALAVPAHPGLRFTAVLIFIVLALIAAVQSWVGWARAELALRLRQSIPAPAVGVAVAVGAVAAILIVGIGSFV